MEEVVTINVADLSVEQFQAMLRKTVREELHDAGLRIDSETHQDAAREDFRFLRKLRVSAEATSSKVGMAVILVVSGGIITALWSGLKLMFRQ
jgi:hypothetical protein